ncbi:MAG: uncharacterized protein JWQ43_887 [Glaciihabitans sp.]|nr:uncharacterized protein [Glaciihabitans sp.]
MTGTPPPALGSPSITGIVLAAGAGSRMGQPKGLVLTSDGTPWITLATQLLAEANCWPVLAVVGAQADSVAELVTADDRVSVVHSVEWRRGMSHSLRAGLDAAVGTAALVILVDTPGLPLSVLERLLSPGAAGEGAVAANTLRQAVFNGQPGHPVLIGSDHWADVMKGLTGDHGARKYLVANGVHEIECGDLFDGDDIDRPLSDGPPPSK